MSEEENDRVKKFLKRSEMLEQIIQEALKHKSALAIKDAWRFSMSQSLNLVRVKPEVLKDIADWILKYEIFAFFIATRNTAGKVVEVFIYVPIWSLVFNSDAWA